MNDGALFTYLLTLFALIVTFFLLLFAWTVTEETIALIKWVKMPKPPTTTIRVSQDVYDRICKIKMRRSKKKLTYNEVLEELMAVSERLTSGNICYVVGDKLFRDVAEARGEAIEVSFKNQQPAEWPDIYVSVGKADPYAGE